ncbi:MAG: VWA domain-containing protein [Candidatus Solibacter usitatus]|nr:VWA domain-containing protein [Candidatus Solibacter usitatus]
MMMRRFLGPVLAVALAAGCALVLAQSGPKKESGDTVARPKKKADPVSAEKPAETPAAPAAQGKIPSKLQKKKPGEGGPAEGPTFRSDTLTVNVDVGVLDNRGRFIPGIPAGNFRIMEDGVPQKVTGFNTGEAPITLAMVIEFSNLYQQYWSYGWQETLTACYGFLQTLRPEDSVAVVAFDLRPEILSDFSTNRQDTNEALARLRIPGFSESNLYDALTDVADRMSDIEGRKAILYIGSGMDTFSKITFDQTRRKLQTASVPIYALGTLQSIREYADSHGAMGPIQRLDFLQADNQLRTFAKETGGQAWFPRFFGEYGGIFRQVNEALRNTYSLAYQPTNSARDGKYRKIKVELVSSTGEPLKITDEKHKPMKYTITAKTGYTAPREVE